MNNDASSEGANPRSPEELLDERYGDVTCDSCGNQLGTGKCLQCLYVYEIAESFTSAMEALDE